MIASHLRVATYNIHGCVGMDRRYAPDRVAAVLKELDAGAIGLQEVDTRRPHHEGRHQLDYLRDATGLNAVAGPTITEHGGEFGNALLTRWPIAAVRRCDLSLSRRERRGALDVEVTTPEGTLRVLVTHLGLSWGERTFQIERLLMTMEPLTDRPTLLMGDFNDWLPYGGLQLRALARYFSVAYGGRSYPAALPLLGLDRIYAHPRPRFGASHAHRSALARRASDHLPVILQVAWESSGEAAGLAAGVAAKA